jgi:hypothetical protein
MAGRVQARRVPAHSAPKPSWGVGKKDLIKVQGNRGIRGKRKSAAQSWALGRGDIEPIADEYAGVRICVAEVPQRDRHLGQLCNPPSWRSAVTSAISRMSSRNFGVMRVVVS